MKKSLFLFCCVFSFSCFANDVATQRDPEKMEKYNDRNGTKKIDDTRGRRISKGAAKNGVRRPWLKAPQKVGKHENWDKKDGDGLGRFSDSYWNVTTSEANDKLAHLGDKTNFEAGTNIAIHRTSKIARLTSEYQSARQKQLQTKLTILPNIHAEFSRGNSNEDYTQEQKGSVGYTRRSKDGNAQIVLSQNVFNGFSTVNNMKASEENANAAKWKLEAETQQVIYSILEATCTLWYSTEKFKFANMKRENLEKALKGEKARFVAGLATKFDVSKAEADYAEAIYSADQSKFELLAARANFKKLTTLVPLDDVELPDICIDIPEDINEIKKIAFTNNPLLLSAMFAQKASEHLLDATYGRLGPKCDLKLSLGKSLHRRNNAPVSGDRKYTENKNFKSISFTATLPIFENSEGSGNTYSAIALAREESKRAACDVVIQRTAVENDCITNYEQYVTCKSLIKSASTAVHSAEVGVAGDRQESELGMKSITETLVREKQLCDLRISLAEAKHKLVLAKGKILQSMGKLTFDNVVKGKKISVLNEVKYKKNSRERSIDDGTKSVAN